MDINTERANAGRQLPPRQHGQRSPVAALFLVERGHEIINEYKYLQIMCSGGAEQGCLLDSEGRGMFGES